MEERIYPGRENVVDGTDRILEKQYEFYGKAKQRKYPLLYLNQAM